MATILLIIFSKWPILLLSQWVNVVLIGLFCCWSHPHFWGNSLISYAFRSHWHWNGKLPPSSFIITGGFIDCFTDIFKHIFFSENVWIPINISMKFVPEGQIYNIPALLQMMAWRRSGDKLLSEPVMVTVPTHIYVTRPQWINAKKTLLMNWNYISIA